MKIIIEKGIDTDSVYYSAAINKLEKMSIRSKKIYNKSDADKAIQEILEEYKFLYGEEHNDTFRLLNLVVGDYKINLEKYYYSIGIIPKSTKILCDNIYDAISIVQLDILKLYQITTEFKGIETLRHNKFLKYDRHDFVVIDNSNNYLDTFSIYDHKNNIFEIVFDWKYI